MLATLLAVAGCGGGGDDEAASAHPSTSGSSRPTAAASTGFTAGGGGGGSFGGDGFSGGGGGGGGGGGHGRLGGVGGILHEREVRRRAAIERAHRPPGPVRLTGDGLDEDAQRARDWATASASAHPVTSVDDDQCERLWAQHVASSEAYHSTRHDGLHSAISASDERHFLASCRAQSPAMQQCMDRAYYEAHQDECQHAREQDPTHQRADRAAHASREPMQF